MNKEEFLTKWHDSGDKVLQSLLKEDLEDLIHNERMEAIEEYKLKQLGHDEED